LPPHSPALRIAVVGPCASGKSTLTAALRAAGYEARMPAQEHSYVADMWRRLVDPDVLIYLDISYEALLRRRPHFGEREYLEREKARLAHAREHADLVIDTSELAAEEVRARVLESLPQAAP
jgi:deoxyadenosine/deoxycytidine kinase